VALVLGMTACTGYEPVPPKTLDPALEAAIEQVSSARVFFGHQSVGGNILAGLDDLQSQLGKPGIRVVELGDAAQPADSQGVLLHSKVGENSKPASKCQDFRRILDQGRLGRIDAALFKFCYIDFNDASDVEEIFSTYSRTMDDLKQRHPGVLFVHVTAPLRTVDSGPGVWVRELLGRPNRTKLANVRRNEFNRRLHERYGAYPIFDLALAMSTYPDGRRESFKSQGGVYYSLVPAFTNDGGHLNDVGRTYAAAALVDSLADALSSARN
jgi:hypothetical protein